MTKETKHTPTPWVDNEGEILDKHERIICSAFPSDLSYKQDCTNVSHIVKCVNMHDELVGALKKIIDETYDLNANSIAFETLKKAGAL